MGGVANLALQAIPVIASAQKTVSGFQSAGDARYAAQLDAQQKADALAFEKQKAADALALEREGSPPARRKRPIRSSMPSRCCAKPRPCSGASFLQDQATADQAQQADIATRRAQIETSAASDEAARLKALRRDGRPHQGKPGRAAAAARPTAPARRSCSGWSPTPTRSQQEADATNRLRTQALAQEVADTQTSNLLERSQLAEKQRLELFSNAY